MQDFHELQVWQKAHQLTLKIYKLAGRLPKEERFELSSQLRRAAMSIPTNLAEGAGRGTPAELAQFARIASGSASEIEYLLELTSDLGYVDLSETEVLRKDVREIRKMLASFIKTLRDQKR